MADNHEIQGQQVPMIDVVENFLIQTKNGNKSRIIVRHDEQVDGIQVGTSFNISKRVTQVGVFVAVHYEYLQTTID